MITIFRNQRLAIIELLINKEETILIDPFFYNR